MDDQKRDYPVGYGRPPVESRFQKGKSGNPGGLPRRTTSLASLLDEALSQRSQLPKPDGTWMTQAEAIFTFLVAGAAGPDLKAKKLLFDLLIKLHRGNYFGSRPQIALDDYEGDARAEFEAVLNRGIEPPRHEPPQRPHDGRGEEWPAGAAAAERDS
jgi:hypothetical protein